MCLPLKVPVVHDIHDSCSEIGWGSPNIEKIDLNLCDGVVYVSSGQIQQIWNKHRFWPTNSCILPNYPHQLDEEWKLEPPVKYSSLDGQTHLVFQGMIASPGVGSHRDVTAYLIGLASRGIHVHIYPILMTTFWLELGQYISTIHIHDKVDPTKLTWELAQYDAGLVLFRIDDLKELPVLDSMLPNKLFEYEMAGLPVLYPNCRAMRFYIRERAVGLSYDDYDDIAFLAREVPKIKVTSKPPQMIDWIFKVEELYERAIERFKVTKRQRSSPSGDYIKGWLMGHEKEFLENDQVSGFAG